MSNTNQKFSNIAALLGAALVLHSGFFGNKNHIRLSEEDAQKVDDALGASDNQALQERIATLESEKANLEQEKAALNTQSEATENALQQALELNGLAAGKDVEESITLLGTTCKEFGDSQNRHTFAANDGKEGDPSGDGLIDGYIDPKDEHNKIDS